VSLTHAFLIVTIGVGVGFLGGLFGKGGSAVATPLLFAIGVPAMFAVGSPLPAALPSTLVASSTYRRRGFRDRDLVLLSIAVGIPATVAGAVSTRWIDGGALVRVTELMAIGIGARLLLAPAAPDESPGSGAGATAAPGPDRRIVALVAGLVGLASGLLANSGGFLLAPLYATVLRLPIKRAFAASLAVSAALSVPATLIHTALGHVDWTVTALFALGATPLSFVGARVAVRAPSRQLERVYGAGIAALGLVLLLVIR
jgi:uncharacterized membrane protein YfcA